MRTPEVIDNESVDCLSIVMKKKLKDKRAEGFDGWYKPEECSIQELDMLFEEQLGKFDDNGERDWVDISNFAMMIWNRKEAKKLQISLETGLPISGISA